MSATSNDHGRALECLLVSTIIDEFKNISQTKNCARCQQRDLSKVNSLDDNLKTNMSKGIEIIISWLKSLIDIKHLYHIDRLDDLAAVKGDVSDISLIDLSTKKTYNFSIKHNHDATKHQRLPSLMQSLGFEKNSKEDKDYRKSYKKTKEDILKKIKALFPNTTKYNEIKKINPSYIDDNIYNEMCQLYIENLNKYLNKSTAQSLFKFLIGNVGFYKCINYSKYVEIVDFTKITLPSFYKLEQIDNSHISIIFDNGFIFNLRLHSASEKYASLSLKFDTRLVELPDTVVKIKYDKK